MLTRAIRTIMALALQNTLRDNALYAYGYLQGRTFTLPHSVSDVYGLAISKLTSFIALPLPFLSFLALPFFGTTSTSINLVFFYLTWAALVLSHDPLNVELYGTLAIRILCFVLPALGFLAFDCGFPSASQGIKAQGKKHPPLRLGRNRLIEITAVSIFNVLLAVALQAGIELLFTEVLHFRSIVKVSTGVPLPWSIAKDLLRGLALRGVLHYGIHRFVLHQWNSPLKTWHMKWQHSVHLPFSLIAAYDHPVCYILAQFLPLWIPSYLFRFHVLTWHIMLAVVSLEDVFVYSGYAVLPSSIVLAGMARRTDAHFATVRNSEQLGNFGHWGVMDVVCRSSCKGEDVMDDLHDEADKHQVGRRVSDGLKGAKEGLALEDDEHAPEQAVEDGQQRNRAVEDSQQKNRAVEDGQQKKRAEREEDDDHEEPTNPKQRQTEAREDDADDDEDEEVEDEKPPTPGKRRSGRRRAKKAA